MEKGKMMIVTDKMNQIKIVDENEDWEKTGVTFQYDGIQFEVTPIWVKGFYLLGRTNRQLVYTVIKGETKPCCGSFQ